MGMNEGVERGRECGVLAEHEGVSVRLHEVGMHDSVVT